MIKCSLLWFRLDLRLRHNPTLSKAISEGRPLIPLFIWAPEEEASWAPGAAGRIWLHSSLTHLHKNLQQHGSGLRLFKVGPGELFSSSAQALTSITKITNAETIFYTRRYEPAIIERDRQVRDALLSNAFKVEAQKGNLLLEPWEVATQAGKPFQVFTPFWKKASGKLELVNEIPEDFYPASLLEKLPKLPEQFKFKLPGSLPGEVSLQELELIPEASWARSMQQFMEPGEEAAQKKLSTFLNNDLEQYQERRDFPELNGCSQLSSHLHFGEISVRQIYNAVQAKKSPSSSSAQTYLKELGWREFSHHLLYHFPHTDLLPLNKKFSNFPWQTNERFLQAWQRGQTGYPIVDAGMRQLRQTGIMHNRVRMIVASFLVKDLLWPWQDGSKWFWETLVDADLAQNSLGWQWSAGCGADAAPYFRIFNPCLQGQKFDPDGNYVRRYVPELAQLPAKYIHAPWKAKPMELASYGVTLGVNYPARIVDHQEARARALAIYQDLK